MNPNPSPSSASPASSRLWKPVAQKNLRNQWSKMLSSKDRWISASLEGRSHATSLVNAHLLQRYMPEMDLGVLKDMPGIQDKACEKLYQRQEQSSTKILLSYKEMVVATSHLVQASSCMRCFLKGSVVSPFVQFSNRSEDSIDFGLGGGIPVFLIFTMSYFEDLAQEIVEMFVLELSLKRLLVLELLTACKEAIGGQYGKLRWSYELYPGEYNDLRMCNLFSTESGQPLPPQLKDRQPSGQLTGESKHHPDREVLQVYLTTWLADVNINMNRITAIFSMVEEEMQVKLS